MLLAAALVALAAVLPALATATVVDLDRRLVLTPGHMCGTQGGYAPGSAYEANLRRLAATVAAEVNANPCNCSVGSVAGRRHDLVTASAHCYWRPGASSPDCGACVALAFRKAQRLCPYHRQAVAVVDGGACSVSFLDVQRREQKLGKVHHGDATCIFHSGSTDGALPRCPPDIAVSSNWDRLCCLCSCSSRNGAPEPEGAETLPSTAKSTFLSLEISSW